MKSNGKIRVLQLGSPTGLYGAERWILALIRHLDPSSVESTVSVIKDDPFLTADLCTLASAWGFRTHIFESYGKISFSAIGQLRNFIKSNDIHILHGHGYKTDIIGWLSVQGTSCKILSTPHGWSKKAGIKLGLYEMLNRCLFPFFDSVAPLSKDLYRGLKRVPGLIHKLHFIENGVDIDEINSVTQISPDLCEWKEKGYFVIGYIGQLIHRKGIDILLRALADLNMPNVRLALVGEGEQQDFLATLADRLDIAGQVRFFGFRKDRISLLKGFDIFVLPSMLEGIPRCLMEAMAAGVPVLANDIPGCQELVVNNVTGLAVKVDSSRSLAAGITELLTDESLRHRLSTAGRMFVSERFSSNRMANQYLDLYRSLTAP
jgi:glycosyltransferase involved in cell wall biosynthesis